jgi:hypothetical protein
MVNNKSCSECGSIDYCAKGLCGKCYQRNYYHRPEVKVKVKKYGKEYYQQNKEKVKEYNQQPKIKERRKKYIQRPKVKEYRKKYYQQSKVKDKFRIYQKEYNKKRYEKDIHFRIMCCLRARLYQAIKNIKGNKNISTMKLIGCLIEELKIHLEKQFDKKMNWQNMGIKGWHIDHKIACCKFDLTNEEEQKKCFHYTNLQPLWHTDHRKKSIKDKKRSIRYKLGQKLKIYI